MLCDSQSTCLTYINYSLLVFLCLGMASLNEIVDNGWQTLSTWNVQANVRVPAQYEKGMATKDCMQNSDMHKNQLID